MRLGKALENKIMDTRLRDKLVAEGKITQAQVEQFLSGLTDDAANMTSTDEKSESEE